MSARIRRVRPVAGMIAALVLCATGVAAAEPATRPTPRWTGCTAPGSPPEAECATLAVPLDHARPRAGTISLALARLPALDPARRIGALLLNPGGPGSSGVGAVSHNANWITSPEFRSLRQRFDIVGFDPRGVGASTPVSCPSPLHDPAVTRFPSGPAEYAALARFNREAGLNCRDRTGPLVDHVDTGSVVEDVEAIRAALGENRISWIGLSYGTEIGARYAERFPHRVRAMVLDGVVDHSLPARRAAVDEARATEVALDRFARWCTGNTRCALSGQDVLGGYDRVLRSAERGSLVAASLGRAVTAEEVTAGVYGLLTSRAAWPRLADALASAASGDASPLMAAVVSFSPKYPAYRTVGCHDFAPDTWGWPDLVAQQAFLRAVAPRTWRYSEFWDWISGCLGWPIRAANPPRPLHVRGVPPVLLVNTRFDPGTPYRWARRVQGDIEGSRLLTVEGDGHTGTKSSSCARTRIAEYLVDRTLPPPGASCPTTEPTG